MEITRHFTATTHIVYRGKVLLHLHKKLNIWIPVGGHIDRDELPQETALREIKEESGLAVKLYNPDQQVEMGDTKQLIRPMYILLEKINEFHQHIDFIYFAQSNTFELKPEESETNNLQWFTIEEVLKLEGVPENVKRLSAEAIEIFAI
jgi:8-oxo-dGTP pyrophosphatase MutT (NUDIX family)